MPAKAQVGVYASRWVVSEHSAICFRGGMPIEKVALAFRVTKIYGGLPGAPQTLAMEGPQNGFVSSVMRWAVTFPAM
jgi:hypothetical protein